MISILTDFISELRAVGVPVSMVEAIDAMEAIRHVDLADREALKATLGATLVKNARHYPAFETAFEVFFALTPPPSEEDDPAGPTAPAEATSRGGRSGAAGGVSLGDLIDALFQALGTPDWAAVAEAARQAVEQLAGMEPGRPVGGTYYLYRTLRQLDIDRLRERLLEAVREETGERVEGLDERLVREEVDSRLQRLREEIAAEIRRRLVADRGREAVAKTLRQPLVEEIDLMHATRQELRSLEEVIEPLTRKLAARLAQRRRRGRKGRLDFRKTARASLATGGVPMEPKFKLPRPHRPEVFLLCDISGSMATFARFTLQFTYAMATQFSRLRSFVFVDAVDEVTRFLTPGVDFGDALARISTEADVVWLDGHSDYGHALEQFEARYGRELTPRSTVIIAGDARNNYREAREGILGRLAEQVEAVYWLNPEPKAYWNSGDSVMGRYAAFCTEVFEVRNLRQLEEFVERVTVRPPGPRRIPSTTPTGVPM